MTGAPWTVERLERVRTAAMDYVVRGWWPLIAGSIWNQHCFIDSHGSPVGGVKPLFEPAASRSPHAVWMRWSDAPYAILATGEVFDVLAAPSTTLRAAMAMTGSAIGSCPVVTDPLEQLGWVLIRPGHRLDPRLAGIPGVGLLPASAHIPLPPTEIKAGQFRWLADPKDCGYQLGDPARVQAELAAQTENRRPR